MEANPPQPTLPGRLLTAALIADEMASAAVSRALAAEAQVRSGDYLISLGQQLGASIESQPTRDTVARVAFPETDAWAIVDLETDAGMIRLAIVHPDPAKRDMAALLNTRWVPGDGDPIGLPSARQTGKTFAITSGLDDVLQASAHGPSNLDLLQAMGFEACLVVPLRTDVDQGIDGAITFVSSRTRLAYTAEEIELAEHIAMAASHALRSARLFAALDGRRLAAEDANRKRTIALGRVTHELRTPLNAIGGYADLLNLGDHGALTEAQQHDVERIRWNQHYLLTLITDIMNYVRLDARRVDFAIADMDLHQVSVQTVGMLEALFAKKQQRVSVDDPVSPMLVRGDAARVQQIVLNVLTNAHKYSPAATMVSVRCSGVLAEVYVDIADAGAGIPVDQRESIFEPFVQLASGEPGRDGGVGLGLAIARELARGMNGDLTVHAGPDGGAVFRLSLPRGNRSGA